MERYGLYGVIPRERESNEAMDYDTQNIGDKGDALIYETNDREEARRIYEAGGFMRGEVWYAVTRMEDRTKRPQADVKSVIDKRTYDQS